MSTELRTQPHSTVPSGAEVHALSFRDAMAQLGAAVHIVTTDGDQGKAGFAASAICGVTDSPPTMLVCLQHTSSAYAAVKANGIVCINTLDAEHEGLSKIFGGKTPMSQRFDSAEWSTLTTGAPVLTGARLSLDCEVTRAVNVGTHDVLFCEVKAMKSCARGVGGLYYIDRSYHTFSPSAV